MRETNFDSEGNLIDFGLLSFFGPISIPKYPIKTTNPKCIEEGIITADNDKYALCMLVVGNKDLMNEYLSTMIHPGCNFLCCCLDCNKCRSLEWVKQNKERLRKLIPILDDESLEELYNCETSNLIIANPILKYIDVKGVRRSIETTEHKQLHIMIKPVLNKALAERSIESAIEIIGMDCDFLHKLNGSKMIQWAGEIQKYLAKVRALRGECVCLFKCLDEFVLLDIPELDHVSELRRVKDEDLM